jgi:hypothetical protein
MARMLEQRVIEFHSRPLNVGHSPLQFWLSLESLA